MKPHRRPSSDVLASGPSADMVALARRIIEQSQAANAEDIDEEELRERAIRVATRMKQARTR